MLIGHSQGTIHLIRLIAEEIEGRPEASRMISALLLGYNVEVPEGGVVGGSFRSTPLCTRAGQTGCVITYVSFRADAPPPAGALFGRATRPGMTVGCTNPAGLGSARASSFVLVLLSNLGVVGTMIFVIFAIAVFTARLPKYDPERNEDIAAVRAAKLGFYAVLVTATISGTVYDLGLTFYILAGGVAALSLPRSVSRPAHNNPAFRFAGAHQDAAQARS